MKLTNRLLVAVVVPAVLAVGVAAGVVFAQSTGNGHDDDGDTMGMGAMMDPAAMQDHMKELLGAEAYQQMVDTMANHAGGMAMDMNDMDGMMAAMSLCFGGENTMTPAASGTGQHDAHHPVAAP